MRINNTKRSLILLLALMLWITASAALAEHTTPRVYHAPRTGKAPFMEVPEAATSLLAEGQDTLDVYFINIGIGDAMYLTCGGQSMLIDGGTYSRYPRLTAFLESKEIRSFDYIFVTHAHDDHVQGPDRLLAKGGYDAGEVLVLHEREYRNASHQIFMETVESRSIPYRVVKAGDTLTLGGAELTFLNNPVRPSNRSINAISMMLHIRFGKATMLLTADVSGESLDIVVRDFPHLMKVDIMKSPHHGLNRLTVPFQEATQPELVVITSNMSGGKTLAAQLKRNKIPHYYISMGTVHCQTDGQIWYVMQEK